MKKIISLTLLLLIVTGCSFKRINDDSFDNVINSVLYQDTTLFNMTFDGYKFYLPRGTKVLEQRDYNLEIKDKDNIYYLYVSPIEYYYKTKSNHEIDKKIFYSKNLSYKDYTGYVDVTEVNDKYFVEVVYNYAKVETYVNKENLNNSFFNICYILSTIKFNDSAISYKLSKSGFDLTTEEFSIFKSKKSDDNFLKYVEEYDKYDNKSNAKDDDVIETDEGEW